MEKLIKRKDELLDNLTSFKNHTVIDSFCNSLNVDKDFADIIFSDLMRFFWLSNSFEDEDLKTIDTPIIIIDEMWHTYILHTKEYFHFCEKFFGRYIHHTPVVEKSKSIKPLQEVLQEKRRRYTKIYDYLGEDIFIRWFQYYPDNFSSRKILALKKR